MDDANQIIEKAKQLDVIVFTIPATNRKAES